MSAAKWYEEASKYGMYFPACVCGTVNRNASSENQVVSCEEASLQRALCLYLAKKQHGFMKIQSFVQVSGAAFRSS